MYQECVLFKIGMWGKEGERSDNFSSLSWLHTVTGICPWQVKKKKRCMKNISNTSFICSVRPGFTNKSRKGKAHHYSTQAVLCILAEKWGTVGREIQIAEWIADVSWEFPFVLALPFKPVTNFGTILNNTKLTSFLHCGGCLTRFPRGREKQQLTT